MSEFQAPEWSSMKAPAISAQGASNYEVGDEGQPQQPGEEGSNALRVALATGIISSHEQGPAD